MKGIDQRRLFLIPTEIWCQDWLAFYQRRWYIWILWAHGQIREFVQWIEPVVPHLLATVKLARSDYKRVTLFYLNHTPIEERCNGGNPFWRTKWESQLGSQKLLCRWRYPDLLHSSVLPPCACQETLPARLLFFCSAFEISWSSWLALEDASIWDDENDALAEAFIACDASVLSCVPSISYFSEEKSRPPSSTRVAKKWPIDRLVPAIWIYVRLYFFYRFLKNTDHIFGERQAAWKFSESLWPPAGPFYTQLWEWHSGGPSAQ